MSSLSSPALLRILIGLPILLLEGSVEALGFFLGGR